jgi:hypothetical protein
MKLLKIGCILRLFLLLTALAPVALSQGTGASLNGTVKDSTGAAVPNAKVTIQNVDTNLLQTTQSDAEGVYNQHSLPPGNYKIMVESQSFQTYLQQGIILTVNQAATVNIILQTGAITQTVTVNADAALINTTTAELSTIVTEHAITQLPLNGRDPSSLVFLAPGETNVLNTGGGQIQGGFSFPTETGGAANGGRQGSTYYLLDGISNMDTFQMLAAPFPNADATQEFRVITNNFDAHYGFAPGAVVSIETKSGTNSFHGGIFEFIRNNDLNAGNYFTHAVDPLKRNQFGGSIGGPALKNRIFFFANYQGTRDTQQGATNTTYTPTAAMLQGDFSAVPITLKGPFATVNGKPNQVNPSLLSPAAVAIAETALPPGQIASSGQTNYSTGAVRTSLNEGTGRIDFDISGKQRLTVRTFIDNLTQPSGAVNGNILSALQLNPYTLLNGENMEYYNNVLTHMWTISPSLVNNFSVFWTQMSSDNSAVVKDDTGAAVCLSRYIKVNELPGQCYLEGLNVSNGFSTGYYEPSQEIRTSYGVSDTVTKTIGLHTLSFGGDYWHQYAQQTTQFPTQPIVSFNGSYTGFGLADYLLGDVSSFEQGAGQIAGQSGIVPGVFAQDQYRMRPNITITAGLRWDPNLPPTATGGRGAAFIPGEQSTQYPNAPTGLVFPGDPHVDSSLMPTSYGYFEPRVGIAWQPKSLPNTSVHGGFGMFSSPLPYSYYVPTVLVSPFSPTFTLNSTSTSAISFQDPWAGFSGTDGVSPFPPFASTSVKPPSNASFQTPISVPAVFSNNFRLGMTQSWNLSVEQAFPGDLVLRLAYVGSESYHQVVELDQNPGIYASGGNRTTYPNFSNIYTYESIGTSPYNSLQVGIEKRLSHNLQFQSNFTWSKVIDLAAEAVYQTAGLPNPFNIRFNRGISSLNVPFISISNLVYTTPDLMNHNGFVHNLLGAWEVSAIVTAQSGAPFSIVGGNGNNNSEAQQYGDRADIVPGQIPYARRGGRQQWLAKYVNTAAFTTNSPGTFGNSGKNIFTAPPVNNIDMGIDKNWRLAKRYQLQFRWEMFNAFNHPSFGAPVNDPTASNFGQITSIGYIPPRVMQGALKLNF